MLLPSALPCDMSQPSSRPRLQAALFASPPASPPALSSHSAFGNIVTSCRSLQSLITAPIPDELPLSSAQLPTPPLTHAPPPLKLRLRSRAARQDPRDDHLTPRKKIAKRAPPRGANKRRRDDDDDGASDRMDDSQPEDDLDSDLDISASAYTHQPAPAPAPAPAAPSTPKRARIAPEQLPLGLERSDFHDMLLREGRDLGQLVKPGTGVEVEADGEEWSAEDDRILVELVLDKLKLSKTEWQDCARSLGKDRHTVGRRWKSLMAHGDVGLKTRSSRRARLHATWR
ncbi:hypothetical protein B0I35DRAFT_405711 [Stachybotrys elegans]|uniref:Myb-like domain-containing protein n=1 Tax=Stachybotrys elegans TaxID=80388 RepID=A0A8K0T102_9HYPO|nr:hypothetical protein B0I35DRAFT_405711 [Stachybotrys elegans]